ncbi:MAG TPA: hypothetical protein VK675_01560 [Candidatus Paceibacterota bacterium]|nr:hypothetical protein [Candidatus Paceibacterota bacterium]
MKDARKSNTQGNIGLVLIVVVVAIVAWNARMPSMPYTNNFVEKLILRKAVRLPVSPGVFPVAIYEVGDKAQSFSSSGVCFTNSSGGIMLLTVGSSFHRRSNPVSFVVRKLTPSEDKPSWCVKRIIKIGKQWGTDTDLALCEVVQFVLPLPEIKCDADTRSDNPTLSRAYTFEEAQTMGLKQAQKKKLISLVSGKSVNLMAIVPEEGTGVWYFLADCTILPGEGGTGFVDDAGKLYIAEGSAASNASPAMVKYFGFTTKLPSLIYGPVGPIEFIKW